MPSVFGASSPSIGGNPGFLTPRVGPGAQLPSSSSMSLTPTQRQDLTNSIFREKAAETDNRSWYHGLANTVAGTGIDLADTVVSALSPAERGDVWGLVDSYGGAVGNDLKDYYTQHQGKIELLSGLTGAIATGYVASELFLPKAASALMRSTALTQSRLWQAGARVNALSRSRMIAAQEEAALNQTTIGAFAPVRWKFYGVEAAKMAGKAGVEEALIGATMHTNQAIWSDDMSTNLAWGAAGIGLGATLGGVAARYEMRRLANDPAILAKRADAVDPQGFTGLREHQDDATTLMQMSNLNAKESTGLTISMLEARQATPANATPDVARRFEQARNAALTRAQMEAQRISGKGIPGIPATSFSVKPANGALAEGSAGQHLMNYLFEQDALGAQGLDSMGILRPARMADKKSPLGLMLDERDAYVQNLTASKVPADNRLARKLDKQEPEMLVNGESWLPVKGFKEAEDVSKYQPGRLVYKPSTKGVNEFNVQLDNGTTIRINERFQPMLRTNKPIGRLDMNEWLQVNEATRNLMSTMLNRGVDHIVPPAPSWYQLDSAIEYERRGGKVKWQTGVNAITNAQEAQVESLKLKAAEIGNNPIGSYWDRLRYNLPLPTASERMYDATGDSLNEVLKGAAKGLNLDDLTAVRKQIMDVAGFDLRSGKPALDGSMFTWNLTPEGKWRQPVVGYFDAGRVDRVLSPLDIAQQMAEVKAARLQALAIRQPGDTHGVIPEALQELVASPDWINSMSIRGMADDQMTGLGNVIQQGAGEILTREMRMRDQAQLLSALRVAERKNRMTNDTLTKLTEDLVPIRNQLNSAAGASSRSLVNQFNSLANGWDIKQVVPHGSGDGRWAFELADTANNQMRLGVRKIEEGDLLTSPNTGAEVIVDDLALDYITRFQTIAEHLRADQNRIRGALGLQQIGRRNFYVPPPNTKNKFIGFTFDANNHPVPGGAVIADTQAEFDRLVALKDKELAGKPGFIFRTRDQVAARPDMFDMAMMDWVNPGMAYGVKRPQKGTLSSDRINPNAISDQLDWIKRMHEQNMTDILRVTHDSQLAIARARGAVERLARHIPENSPQRTIWDEYEAIILGKNLGDMQRSVSGVVTKAVESRINLALAASWPAMRWMSPKQLGNWTADLLERSGVKIPRKAATTYNQLVTDLGPHSPYATAVDYAEQNFKVVRPPEIRDITQKLNKMSASLILRYLDYPMAAMNMLGIITTLPSILRSGKAPITTFVGQGGKRVGVVDGMRILMDSMRDMSRNDAKTIRKWEVMTKNGDASQQVADFNVTMSNIQDRSTFNRIMMGDRTIPAKNILNVRSMKDVKDIAKNKGVDGLISVLTDTTENWSRSWAHFAGLRLAEMQGIIGEAAQHDFAREIANAAIANYNPMNRPELYQSAFGSMFGLFMSYMQSYNQRLFRWMETKDYMSVGRQLGMQSALFGISSLPGFNYVQNALLSAGLTNTPDGDEATLMDHIYAKLGPELGSAFAHGGISQLGVALYTRGDMNFRDVTMDPTRLAAGLGVLKNAASAVMESYSTLMSDESLSDNNRLAEVLARNMPNRVMKGIMTQLANGGRETDVNGQIVSENRNFFESALRMSGVRSTYQQGRIDAFYASKNLKAREASRMERLRLETRALIRNDPNWKSKIQEVFDKHMAAGGRPEHFRQWIQDQLRSATTRRDVRDLQEALRNPKTQLDVWRYNAYAPD